jgi:hypothetical protein
MLLLWKRNANLFAFQAQACLFTILFLADDMDAFRLVVVVYSVALLTVAYIFI